MYLVKRNKFYHIYYRDWYKDDDFQSWLSEYCKDEVLKRKGDWFLWLEKYARKGSHKHLQTLLEIAKEFTPSPLVSFPEITYVFNSDYESYKRGQFPEGVVYTESGSGVDDTERQE